MRISQGIAHNGKRQIIIEIGKAVIFWKSGTYYYPERGIKKFADGSIIAWIGAFHFTYKGKKIT